MSSGLLAGKAAIVTGGGTLFGEAVAKVLIADGAKVLIVEINAESGEAAAKNVGASFVQADITNDGDIDKVITTALKELGKIDVLVNLACSYDDAGSATTRSQWMNTLIYIAFRVLSGELNANSCLPERDNRVGKGNSVDPSFMQTLRNRRCLNFG